MYMIPVRKDESGQAKPQDADPMIISGEIPVVDLSSANAVIDEERKKNRELEAKLAESEKNFEQANQSKECWKKASAGWKQEAEKDGKLVKLLTVAVCLVSLVALFLGVWRDAEHEVSEHFRAKSDAIERELRINDINNCQSVTIKDISELPSGIICAKLDFSEFGACDSCGEKHYYVGILNLGKPDQFRYVPRDLYNQLELSDVIEKTSAFTAIRRAAPRSDE